MTTTTLKTFLLCPCGAQATIGYAFPGQPERGICDLHEKSIEMRRELSPGRAEVASVRRLDEAEAPVEFRQVEVLSAKNDAPPPDVRELNWIRDQFENEKTRHAETREEAALLREQLAEAREALAAVQPSTVDGEAQP